MVAPTSDLDIARDAMRRRDHQLALRSLVAASRREGERHESLNLMYEVLMNMGRLGQALEAACQLWEEHGSRGDERRVRSLLGRLIETDPEWLPSVTGGSSYSPAEKRILHLLKESRPYSESGFTMRSTIVLEAQRRAGFEPVVVTSLGFPRTRGIDTAPLEETIGGIRHYHPDLREVDDVRSQPLDFLASSHAQLTAEIVTAEKPSLIQAATGYRGYETALVGLALARRFDLPFVYEVRGFQEHTWTADVASGETGEYFRRRQFQENRCMLEADHVVTIADVMARDIVARGIPEKRVSVVPNMVDPDRFHPRPKRNLTEHCELSGRFVLGYVSNLGAREGIDTLIRATGILRSRHLDVACILVGDGPERDRLRALVDDLDLGGVVVMTGHVPNETVEDYYALIDLFVVPRVDDRASRLVTPMKPLEAMAMGIPIVVSRLPALEELIGHGSRGVSVPTENPTALADAAEALMANAERRRELGRAGRDWVLEHRTIANASERYAQILGPLL